MAKKKKASAADILYTDITTHSLLALAVFGLVMSSVATTFLGAGFVFAAGQSIGDTQDAAAVALAIDDLNGSANVRPMPTTAGMNMPPMHHDDMRTGSSTMPGMQGTMGPSTVSCKPLELPRSLTRGSTGDDVKNLQQTLIGQGMLASSSATGFFGALTERAVGVWQMQAGLASSSDPDHTTGVGMVGPRTRALFMKCMGIHDQGQNQNGNRSQITGQGSSTPPMPPRPPMASSTVQQ